jgi:hypothetical protein
MSDPSLGNAANLTPTKDAPPSNHNGHHQSTKSAGGAGSRKAEGPIESPDRPTADGLWRIVIYAVAFVMVVSVLALAGTLYLATIASSNPQVMVTIFTSAVAFLAGVFAPSPAQGSGAPASNSSHGDADSGLCYP